MGIRCRGRSGVWGLLMLGALVACTRTPPASEAPRAVRTWQLQAEQGDPAIAYAAEVRARSEALLGFRVGGKLLSREVQLGQVVQAGQVLARLDPVDLQLAQQAAQANLAAADTQWLQAQADFKRFQALQAQGFISAAELERRQTALEAARAQRDQARASSHLQGNQAAHAVLRADSAGVVTAVLADPGTVMAAGTPVLKLAQAGPRDAVFSVPEDRVALVLALLGRAKGLQVRLGSDPTLRAATLREVAAAADPTTRTFLAKADLGEAGAVLNQTASVLLPSPPADAGTRVLPMVAVAEREGHSVVWLLDPVTMTVQPRTVEVLEAKGLQWRVRGELPAGVELVTAGLHVLQPGQTVRRYGDAQAAASAPAAR